MIIQGLKLNFEGGALLEVSYNCEHCPSPHKPKCQKYYPRLGIIKCPEGNQYLTSELPIRDPKMAEKVDKMSRTREIKNGWLYVTYKNRQVG